MRRIGGDLEEPASALYRVGRRATEKVNSFIEFDALVVQSHTAASGEERRPFPPVLG